MKKLLFQLDTDCHPSVFDTVVAYDGGADHVIGHGGLTPDTVSALVQGAIFTRAPKDKKNTAIFIGGSNLAAGEALLQAVQKNFFAGFQVSVMFDSNGCNTTAAAAVAKLSTGRTLQGKKAVVLAGTGPVGQRAAVMLAKEGASVTISSRKMATAVTACDAIKVRYNIDVTPFEAESNDDRGRLIADAHIVLATGAAGVALVNEEHWRDNAVLEVIADANTTPPLGIGGTDMMDKGVDRYGKVIWGAIGFGAFKLALHRACIGKLFEDNKQVFDAEAIYALAKVMA
jgi:hypothetical protein